MDEVKNELDDLRDDVLKSPIDDKESSDEGSSQGSQ